MIIEIKRAASQRLIWLIASSVLFLALSACKKEEQQAGRPTKGGPSAISVQTTTVQRISIERSVDLAGTLVSPDQARVSSEVAGVVKEVLMELGQEVRAGQVLVRLDPRELELAVRRAESLLRQTEAQLGIDGVRVKQPPPDEQISMVRTAAANRDDARAQLARAQRLSKQRLLAQADLDTAETRVKVTEAAYQTALENVQSLKASLQERRGALELAQKKLADATIKSPVAGSVSDRLVHPGEFIQANTPVVGLVQMNPLKLRTAVQERYASLIRPNLTAQFRVESFPGEVFSGRVAYVSPAVDEATRTFAVEVLVDNSNRKLKPGFFAKGLISVRRDENVPAIPEESVSTLAGVSTVFVIQDNKVRQQIVSLGVRSDKFLEVLDGLKGDEVLATSSLNQLANGTLVQVGSGRKQENPGGPQTGGDPPGQEKKGRRI